MQSGIREFPLMATLRFRNRMENGLTIVDEEYFKWEECLQRYEPIEQIINSKKGEEENNQRSFNMFRKDEPIIMAIDSLFVAKSINTRYKRVQKSENPRFYPY